MTNVLVSIFFDRTSQMPCSQNETRTNGNRMEPSIKRIFVTMINFITGFENENLV